MTGPCFLVMPLVEAPSKRERERLTAIELLRRATGRPDASITHDAQGSPMASVAGLHISVSHNATHAALAWSTEGPVGIDVEEPGERLARIVPRVMRADEPAGIEPVYAWRAKEAVFKAAGVSGMVLGDIRLLDAGATLAVIPDGRRFAVAHRDSPPVSIAWGRS